MVVQQDLRSAWTHARVTGMHAQPDTRRLARAFGRPGSCAQHRARGLAPTLYRCKAEACHMCFGKSAKLALIIAQSHPTSSAHLWLGTVDCPTVDSEAKPGAACCRHPAALNQGSVPVYHSQRRFPLAARCCALLVPGTIGQGRRPSYTEPLGGAYSAVTQPHRQMCMSCASSCMPLFSSTAAARSWDKTAARMPGSRTLSHTGEGHAARPRLRPARS